MAREKSYAEALRYLQTLFDPAYPGEGSDAELVERIAAGGDPATRAFETIVARHGAMVWGVCRSLLGDHHDAEDAFQATFLVLVRRAGTLRLSGTVGGWLHSVAVTVSRRARADATRRARREPSLGDGADQIGRVTSIPADRDEIAAVHEELAGLAASQRQAIVLCHLQGLSHEQAAATLGWPVGTVRSRLARGRERLRTRLVRRGVGPAVGLGLAADSLGSVPPVLAGKAVTAAVGRVARGGLAAGSGTVPAAVASLASGVVTSMVTSKMMTAAGAGVLGLAAFLGTAATLSGQDGAPPRGPRDDEGAPAVVRDGDAPRERRGDDPFFSQPDRPLEDPNRASPENATRPERPVERDRAGPSPESLQPGRPAETTFDPSTLPGREFFVRDPIGPGGSLPGSGRPNADRTPSESSRELTLLLEQARDRLKRLKAERRDPDPAVGRASIPTTVQLAAEFEVKRLEARRADLIEEYEEDLQRIELRRQANKVAIDLAETRLRGASSELEWTEQMVKKAVISARELQGTQTRYKEIESELKLLQIASQELELQRSRVARRLSALSDLKPDENSDTKLEAPARSLAPVR